MPIFDTWHTMAACVLALVIGSSMPATGSEICPQSVTTTTPAPPKNPRVNLRIQDILNGISKQDLDAVVVGDSLVAGWRRFDYWTKLSQPLKVYNLGVGADRTQNVLLRMADQRYAQLAPHWALILIGSNNLTDRDPPCAVVAGIEAIAKRAEQLWPRVKIVIVKILPRGRGWAGVQPARDQTNELLDQLTLKNSWKLLDVGSAISCNFTQPCANYAPDLVHLSSQGYVVLTDRAAEAMR